MSHVAAFPLLGLIPFRDHTSDVEDFERTVVFGAAISNTDPSSGRFTFSHHSVGDLNCALHFKQAGGDREIPGWAFAWPVAVGGETEEAGTTGAGRASGPYGGAGGAVPPGIRATPPKTGPAPVTGERTRAAFVPPDINFAPILGGDGYPTDGGFASRRITGSDLPDGWPGFPKGFVGVSMAGTKAKQEVPVFLPTDPRLVAVNFAGDSRMSSVVVDLDDENAIDPTRIAPLHSMFRVVKEPEGKIGFGPRNPLALNFLGGGQDDTAGYGLFFDRVDLIEKRGAPTTPSEPNMGKPPPVTTDLNAPYVDNRGNPSAYMPSTGVVAKSVTTGAGASEATGASGATQNSSESKSAADKRIEALVRMRGVGALSHKASGPIHVGSERDKHKIGETADGEIMTAGHIHTEAYFYLYGNDEDLDYDAPLEFQARKYPKPGPLPFISRTHLVMDHEKEHAFIGGKQRGLWRWYSEFNMGMTPKVGPPPPTTPPNPPPPTTPPDPPPPSTPTTPSEPNIPSTPSTPSAPTPPGANPTPVPETGPGSGLNPPGGGKSNGGQGGGDGIGGGSAPWFGPRDGPFGGTPGPRYSWAGPGWTGRTSAFAPPAGSPLGDDYAAPVARPWEAADGARSVLQAVGEEAHPVLLFRPQSLSSVASDLRRGGGLGEQLAAEAWRPMVGRLEAFGGMVGGDWETTYGPNRGPYGGSGPGGVLFMPPEVSMSDADDLFAPGGVERSTVYFGFAPGAYLGLGLPDLATGGLKTGYRIGHDGAGLAKVEHLDSSGVASEVLGFNASKQLRIRDGAGTILTFSGTLADGEYLKRDGTTLKGGTPAGGSTPTGTGFRHVTSGAEDSAAKLVESADVDAALKDPVAATAGLRTLGTSGTSACAGNDSRLSDARAPDINGLTAETAVDRYADYVPVYDASATANRKVRVRDLAAGALIRSTTHYDVGPSDATEQTIFTGTVPANCMGTDRMLRLAIRGTAKNQTGSGRLFQIRVNFGGSTLLDFSINLASSATLTTFWVDVEIQNDAATNAQNVTAKATLPGGSAPATGTAGGSVGAAGIRTVEGTGTVDTTSDQTLAVTLQLPVSDANLYADIERGMLELI